MSLRTNSTRTSVASASRPFQINSDTAVSGRLTFAIDCRWSGWTSTMIFFIRLSAESNQFTCRCQHSLQNSREDETRQCDSVVDRGSQLWTWLDRFASETDYGNDRRRDEQGSVLPLFIHLT